MANPGRPRRTVHQRFLWIPRLFFANASKILMLFRGLASYGALAACLDQVPFYQVFERISPRRLYHRAVPTAGHPSTRDTNRPCLIVGRERPDVRLCYSALTNSNASKMSFKLNTHSMFATRPVGLCQCLFPANSLTSVQRCRACAPAVRAPATTIIRATPSSRATHSSPPCSR